MNPCTVTVNPDESSVQAAVNAAADGDVICLNAGSVTYTSQVDISAGATKAVEIRGAGNLPFPWGSAGLTVIRADVAGSCVFAGYETTGHSGIISNIKFTFDATSANPFSILNWNLQAGVSGLKPWIVHHCDFEITGRDDEPKCIEVGAHSGLIYRNRFTAERIAPNYINTNIVPIWHGISDDGTFWGSASTFGSSDTTGANNLYVETNYFDGFNVATDRNTSSRMVWRFNEMHNASLSGHGYDSSAYGERHSEVYSNSFICDGVIGLSSWIGDRGGSQMIFNNDFAAFNDSLCGHSGGSGTRNTIAFSLYRLIQCEEIGGWPGLYPDTYPLSHQVGWGWISGSNQTVGDSTHQDIPGGSGFAQAVEPVYIFNNTNSTAGLVDVATGYIGSCRAMAYSNSGKSSGTTLVLAGFVSAGQDAIVAFSDLVGGSTPTIADDKGNTWTALTGGTNGSMRLSAWHARITTGGKMTVTITFASSSAARAGTLVTMRGLTSSALDKNPAVITDNTTPYNGPSTGTLGQADEIVLGYFALNGPTSQSGNSMVTDSIDVTFPDLRAVSSAWTVNGIGTAGTTGSTDLTNVTIAVCYRYVSATTAVQPQITNSTANRNGIAGTVSFKNNGTNPDLQVTDFLQADREYYLQTGSFNGTSGTGSGVRSSRPSTCTSGVAYWSTDQGSWNGSGSGGQGVLDKCTATNTWTNAFYTPYSYPHPLATETGSASAPTGIRSHCAALAAGAFEDITSLIGGAHVWGATGVTGWTNPSYPLGITNNANAYGIFVFAYKATYSLENGRHRVHFFGGGHAASQPPFSQMDHFMIDLDSDTLYAGTYTSATAYGNMTIPSSIITEAASANMQAYGTIANNPAQRKFWFKVPSARRIYLADIDKDTPADIGDANWSRIADLPLATSQSGGVGRLTYFPDRHELLYWSTPDQDIYSMRDNETTWTKRWSVTDGVPRGDGGPFFEYNPVQKCIWGGGGYDAGTGLPFQTTFSINADGTLTTRANMPAGFNVFTDDGSAAGNLPFADPVSGNGLIFGTDDQNAPTAWRVQEYDFDADTWTRRTDIEAAIPSGFAPFTTGSYVGLGVVVLPDFGVTLFMSPAHVWIYRHTADSAPYSFANKLKRGGVLAAWGFDSPSAVRNYPANDTPLKYVWDATYSPSCNSAGLGTNYPLAATRGATEGNTLAYEQNGVCVFPSIDTDVTHAGGNGSLTIHIPSNSTEGVGGYFTDVFERDGTGAATGLHIDPSSDKGPVLWGQWYERHDAAYHALVYDEADFVNNYQTDFATSGAGSTTLTSAGFAYWNTGHLGQKIWFTRGTNFTLYHSFTITNVIDAHTVTLDSSPTPSGAGSGGLGYTTISTPGTQTGWKQAIWYGNPPYASGSGSPALVTGINGYFRGVPQAYVHITTGSGISDWGIQDVRGCSYDFNGLYTYPEPPCIQYKADQWMEFTFRIEIVGNPDDALSKFQMWQDGQLIISQNTVPINWNQSGGLTGYGAFELVKQATGKDPNQIHAAGQVWYDDLIVSTQPIPMGASADSGTPSPRTRFYPFLFR